MAAVDTRSKQPLNAHERQEFPMQSIGTFESAFKEKHGTPRQGAVAPNSKGRVRLHSWLPTDALSGIEEYSHVWIIWVFHANTNQRFKAKVRPPRLKGEKVGAYATRTPHRINPIGLTVVKLERREDGHTLLCSGVDLIDGTPILDIKPYHPCDSLAPGLLHVPGRLHDLPRTPLAVTVSEAAQAQIAALFPGGKSKLELYETKAELLEAITEAVGLDPRTIHSHNKWKNGVFGFPLDRIDVCFRISQTSPDATSTLASSSSSSSLSSSSSSSPATLLTTTATTVAPAASDVTVVAGLEDAVDSSETPVELAEARRCVAQQILPFAHLTHIVVVMLVVTVVVIPKTLMCPLRSSELISMTAQPRAPRCARKPGWRAWVVLRRWRRERTGRKRARTKSVRKRQRTIQILKFCSVCMQGC
jgi:tRNA-Thr(GGU) m(6)t(6)A37 methyltransferase TsaA